jgi:hypothetical protein
LDPRACLSTSSQPEKPGSSPSAFALELWLGAGLFPAVEEAAEHDADSHTTAPASTIIGVENSLDTGIHTPPDYEIIIMTLPQWQFLPLPALRPRRYAFILSASNEAFNPAA